MTDRKPGEPRPTVAPEFAGPGRLASVLKSPSDARPYPSATESVTAADQSVWPVFGVGIIWQTAAENAARLTNVDLGRWLTTAIEEAAAAQGGADPDKR